MSFPARYYTAEAICCGEPIEIGDEITFDANDDVVHASCTDDDPLPPPSSGGIPAFGPRRH